MPAAVLASPIQSGRGGLTPKPTPFRKCSGKQSYFPDGGGGSSGQVSGPRFPPTPPSVAVPLGWISECQHSRDIERLSEALYSGLLAGAPAELPHLSGGAQTSQRSPEPG